MNARHRQQTAPAYFELPASPSGLAGSRVLVAGMGRAGTSAARFLLRAGASVRACDDDPARLGTGLAARLRRAGLGLWQPGRRTRFDWAVVSPGISDEHPLVRRLHEMAVPMVDELDLAARYLPGQLVAVTGTNGKSTTTALIALMLKAAGKRVFCGGNLAPGLPLSAALSRPRQDFYVVEASSFQLERARWLKPRVAVVLNITPDHLNRHQTLRRYAWCKLRVLRLQDEHDFAVLNRDDRLVRSAPTRARRCWFSLSERVDGAWLEENSLWFLGRRVMPASKVRLAGRHNVANALAALSAVRLLGLGNRAVVRTLGTFAGLPHRLEHVRSLAGVDYVNNSMCTNPAAGVHSLVAAGDGRRGGVVLIAGGKGKGLRISEYARAIVRHARWTVLIGDTRWQLARELAARRYERFELASDLGQAVRQARQRAVKGDVVLLSPGFASFDQFADFAARGAAFRHAVNRLR